MPATYTVTEVVGQDNYDFPGDDGQQVFLTAYELKVQGPATQVFDPVTQTAKQDRKVDTAAPKPGDELFVEVTKNKRGDIKLKNAAKRDRDRTPMDGGSRSGYRQQDPPEVVARIGRAHAQQMAIEFIAAAGGEPDLDLTNDKDVAAYLNGPVKRFTDWFATDVDKAGTAADV